MTKLISSKELFDNELQNANGPIIVDFFASRCWPCKMLSPVIDELSNEHPEITFLKVDVDEVPELAHEYGITAMPTIIFWKNHELTDAFIWANPKDFYENKINTLFSK